MKEVFKAVYGLPIATYMKEYRVRRAMELLRESGGSIAAIAAAVGYESQGKFTRAFKDVTGQLPTEYRGDFQQFLLGENRYASLKLRLPRRRVRLAEMDPSWFCV